ncbi:MAG TPA: hypothetical protein VHG52_01870, partial [Thermomicrobiales bacterium]|nr:hypothetical protein [Thermomicrobiales bacterium]
MEPRRKPFLALLRTSILTITLALVTCGAAGGAFAQDEAADVTSELEADLDRIARETAELRELPPLAEIDDVLVSQDELLAMMPELIAEEIVP